MDRNNSFDIMNVLACFSVIMLHHSNIVHNYIDTPSWLLALSIECLFYFAVPCFFMLTGATLMRYDERYDTKTFFRKRLNKTFIPFIFWSFLWLFLSIINGDFNLDQLSIIGIIDGIINTRYQPVYWFFIPLFVIYLLLPLLNKAKDDLRVIKFIIIVLFITGSCFPLLTRLYEIDENPFISNSIFGPLLYVLCGYYFSVKKIQLKYLGGAILLALISIGIRYIVTMILSENTTETNRLLFGYYLPTAVFPAICIFLLINRHDYKLSNKSRAFVVKLSSLSFGIYLIHKLVMSLELRGIGFVGIDEKSFVWILLFPFVTWSICVMIVLTVKKIKISKYIFP